MPDERTTVTELGTALGTLPFDDPTAAMARRPDQVRIDDQAWDRLDDIVRSRRYAAELATAFANGRALLTAEQTDNIDMTLDTFSRVVPLADHERARIDREIRRRRRYRSG